MSRGLFSRLEGNICMACPISFQSLHIYLFSIFHLFFVHPAKIIFERVWTSFKASHIRGTVFTIVWYEVLTEKVHMPLTFSSCLPYAWIHGLFHVICWCIMNLLAHPPDPFLLGIWTAALILWKTNFRHFDRISYNLQGFVFKIYVYQESLFLLYWDL